jgi:hypothetical protein
MVGSYYSHFLLRRIRCSVSVPTVFVICFPTASSLYISHKTRTNKLHLRASHLTRSEIPQNCGYFSTELATRIKYLGSRANSDLFHSVLASSFFVPFSFPTSIFLLFSPFPFYLYPTYLSTYVYVRFYLMFSIHRSIRPSISPHTCLT